MKNNNLQSGSGVCVVRINSYIYSAEKRLNQSSEIKQCHLFLDSVIHASLSFANFNLYSF